MEMVQEAQHVNANKREQLVSKMKLENVMEKNEILNHLLCLFTPLRRMDRIIPLWRQSTRICVNWQLFYSNNVCVIFIYICTCCWMNENHVKVAYCRK